VVPLMRLGSLPASYPRSSAGHWFRSLETSALLPAWLVETGGGAGAFTFTATRPRPADYQSPVRRRPGGRLVTYPVVAIPSPAAEADPRHLRFRVLLNASPLEFGLHSNAPEVQSLLSAVSARCSGPHLVRGKIRKVREDLVSKAVEFFVLNFLWVRVSHPTRLLAIPQRKASGKADRYNRAPFSSYYALIAMARLEKAGLIEMEAEGTFDRERTPVKRKGKTRRQGFDSRWRGKTEFYSLARESGVMASTMIIPRKARRLVELRDKKDPDQPDKRPKVLEWPKDQKADKERMETNLRLINDKLRQSFIGLNVPDATLDAIQDRLVHEYEERRFINFGDKSLRRIFHDGDTHLGGRFYGGWWQSIPSEYRKHITVAAPFGYPTYTHELDYSEMQPRMVYGMIGKPLRKDESPYAIYSTKEMNAAYRDVIKITFLAMLNATDEQAAVGAAQSNIVTDFYAPLPADAPRDRGMEQILPKGCPPLKTVVADILAAHPLIRAKFFNPQIGKQLMYWDSQIIEAVMLEVIHKSGAIPLPIHDSIRVRKGYEDEVRDFMEKEFTELFRREFGVAAECNTKQDDSVVDLRQTNRPQVIDIALAILEPQEEGPKSSVYDALVSDWQGAIDAKRAALPPQELDPEWT
jgi:hypothetical protein